MRKRGRGFSLIELMVIVAIMGIIAAVAIPAFMKYMRRSKTTEAAMSVRKLYDSSVGYFVAELSTKTGAILAKYFPSTQTITPAAGTCCASTGGKCTPNNT